MKTNRRGQTPKRVNRHASAIADKRRARTGAVIRGERYERAEYRNQSMRGEW